MLTMAKKKESGSADDDAKPISYRPSADVGAAMRKYRDQFKAKPTKSAVIERALREFFRAEGIDIELEDPESD
ncbi:unnamed protein product [Gemmata massiliana]|uniref:Uncharacterized protein n=1 Tax=Gemmata massiliana TaxID=1210884 RepID=A0A6P2DDB3_9BACT|nr:hypothetical protein [Gemmata massiliana]VTR97965.1 unnamed protein product [Gemmata massiliana]VTR98906.1 unnamed protein product [Gemmata massiliana]